MLIKQSAINERSKEFYNEVELPVLKPFLLMILMVHFGTQKMARPVQESPLTTESSTLMTALPHSYMADR